MVIHWFRRDLRLEDNAALYAALKVNEQVQPIFIFDKNILDKLEEKMDARVQFIHQEIDRLNQELSELGSSLWVFYGNPMEIYAQLIEKHTITKVYANKDYEPYALQRDKTIFELLESKNIPFIGKKDHVIFEKNEVTKDDGKPYTVYTPYSRKWKAKLNDFYLKPYPTLSYKNHFHKSKIHYPIPTLKEMGFDNTSIDFPSSDLNTTVVKKYAEQRDIPSILGTSRLSLHLRFGTVSIRSLASQGAAINEKWLNELIWRDFYQMILWHFPHSVEGAFKPQYDFIEWRNNEEEFKAWCSGNTGYPIVDAGMRELNATGFMHNRVRMVVASFLTKHLLIDWRWGERYFAEKLLDFELASNVGGWQWAAGSGCDAAPYFRVFNPYEQTKKFDPNHIYIKKWVPEYQELTYAKPIVEHVFARNRVLDVYKKGLNRLPD
jgi:deoxyribodipyrimidine photo-lyase